MGLETALILFGIIGQAVSDDESSSLENVSEVCLKIGLGIAAVEVLIFALFIIAGAIGIRKTSRCYQRLTEKGPTYTT